MTFFSLFDTYNITSFFHRINVLWCFHFYLFAANNTLSSFSLLVTDLPGRFARISPRYCVYQLLLAFNVDDKKQYIISRQKNDKDSEGWYVQRVRGIIGSTPLTITDHVRKHVNALHAFKEAFVKAECSDIIIRDLLQLLRPFPSDFSPGDKVYYKRPDNQKWKGLGTVIGHDGPVSFVRYGGTLVRVHKCRLQNAPLMDSSADHYKDNLATHARKEDDENQIKNDISGEQEQNIETEPPNYNFGKEDYGINNQIDIQDNIYRRDPTRQQSITFKPGCRTSYTDQNSNDKIKAEVLSRTEKSSGRKEIGIISSIPNLHNWKGERYLWI